jgi:hypothetical protein
MISVAKAIVLWCRAGIVQADRLVDGESTIKDISANDGSDPQIAIDNTGDAIAVWDLYDGSNYIYTVQYSYYTKNNNSWSSATTLSNPSGTPCTPQLAMDATGNAIAVWRRYDVSTSSYAIQYSYYTKGSGSVSGSWLPAEDIPLSLGISLNPQVAMDDAGNAIAVWPQNDVIQASYYTKSSINSGWSSLEPLSGGNVNAIATVPQVAMDAVGNAIAIWSQYDGQNYTYTIKYSYYTSGGTWSSAEDLSVSSGDSSAPQLAINSLGNATTVCRVYNGTTYVIQARYYTKNSNGGSWSSPENISSGNGTLPQVAIDSLGNAIAIWALESNSKQVIQASYYTESGINRGWSSPVDLSLYTSNEGFPQIKIDSLGNAIAVWSYSPNGNSIIQASYYTKTTTSGSWLAPELVLNLSNNERSAYSPKIAIDNSIDPTTTTSTTTTSTTTTTTTTEPQATTTTTEPQATTTTTEPQATTTTTEPQATTTTTSTTTLPPFKKTTVKFSIDADYFTIIIGQPLANYESALIDQIVAVTGAPRSSIKIIGVTNGSVVNELTLPAEYVEALQNAVNNGSFFVVINDVKYNSIDGSFVIVDNICFQKGTMILTPNGYKEVENLKMGDLVTTAQGGIVNIQKVTSFVGKREKCPLYVLIKNSLAPNSPIMDLYMSEGHAYRHKGKWSHMKCSSLTIEVDIDNVEYYNIALDNYIENTLIANGVEVESLFNMRGLKMRWYCKKDNCKPIIELK